MAKNSFVIKDSLLVEYNGNDEEVHIPDGITAISIDVFKGNASIKRVYFPNSVKTIYSEAFHGCDNLEYVDFADSVELVRAWAFADCTKLHTVAGTGSLEEITLGAFCDCYSLSNINLSNNPIVGEDCFAGCYNLCDSNGMMVYRGVLYTCSRDLKELTVPDSVRALSEFAFRDNPNLTKVIISANIREVPMETFKNCSALEEVFLPESVKEIKIEAFYGCKKLQKIVLPKNLQIIEDGAFCGCKSLEDFDLPDSIYKIGTEAFARCKNLSADCKDKITKINSDACIKKAYYSQECANSFVFFEFGAKLGSENLLEKIVEKAYSDATNQGAFNTLIGKDETEKRAEADNAKADAIKFLLKKIKEYKEPKGAGYSDWHSKVCCGITRKYKTFNSKYKKLFSYGNAQKWVNMTVKYLLLVDEIIPFSRKDSVTEDVAEILEAVRTDAEYLHMPIDSYVIDALWNETKIKKDKFPEKDGVIPRLNYPNRRPSEYLKSWSTWNKDDYDAFKDEYFSYFEETDEIPVIWEMDAWMERS